MSAKGDETSTKSSEEIARQEENNPPDLSNILLEHLVKGHSLRRGFAHLEVLDRSSLKQAGLKLSLMLAFRVVRMQS